MMFDKSRIKRILATHVDQVRSFMQREAEDKFFVVDLEATSLNTRIAKMVGVSICIDPMEAIYAPTGHRNYAGNLDAKEVMGVVAEKVSVGGYTPVFYNTKYDLNVAQANTGWDPGRGRHLDVLELVYLDNPDRQEKGLKLVAKEDLGFEMTKFEDLFTLEEQKAKRFDLSVKSPQHVLEYATDDSIATRLLLNRYKSVMEEFSFAVKVDTRIVDIVRRVEHNGGMRINEEYIDEQIRMLELRAQALEEQVYRIVGYRFEIGSPKQLGDALFGKLGLPDPGKTRGGQFKTDAESLELLASAHPIAEYVISFKKMVKAKGTYFNKLKYLAESKRPVRFSFHIYAAPTFRFAAPGGDPDRDGMTGVNIQAVSNGEERDMLGVNLERGQLGEDYLQGLDVDELLIDLKEEGVQGDPKGLLESGSQVDLRQLPWVVADVEGKLHCIRENCLTEGSCPGDCAAYGIDTTRRLSRSLKMIPSVRQAFMAPEGYSLCSFDYDRQELVIGANLSGEQNWIGPLSRGEDLHKQSTLSAFSISPEAWDRMSAEEQKSKREVGKVINFAVFFGATGYTIARKANLPIAQGEQIFEGYKRNNPVLFNWITKVHMFSRKSGYTTTYFGRRRWLRQFYEEAARLLAAGKGKEGHQLQAFADRSAVNTCIQGTGAEVTRIAMVKTDKMLLEEGFTRRELFLALQIHDELAYCIKDELIPEIAPKIQKSMAFRVNKWPVQLRVGWKVGKVWGVQKEAA